MKERKNNIFLILILCLIAASLASVYIIEYGFGYQPCKLCVYERVPYVISFFLILKILFFSKYEKITLLILSLVFFISALLAFYHFGIEEGFFNELPVCNISNNVEILSKDELLKQLKQNTVSCKEVNFRVFGFSLAAINSIFSFILSVIFIKLFIRYGKN
jgi:disulfide bond formation protein DsbB